MTGMIDALSALVLVYFLNVFIVRMIGRGFPDNEYRFIKRIYLLTLVLRCCLAIVMNVFVTESDFAGYFWGDSSTYDYRGYTLSLYWSGEVNVDPMPTRWVSGWGFIHFIGVIYYVFGRNQLLVQFLNATVGSITVYVVYLVGNRLFNTAVAHYAATLMAFFPQMVFWSAGIYKDPSILLCIAISMYAVIRMSERLSTSWILLFTSTSLILMTLRFYVFYILVFATFATFLISQRKSLFTSLIAYVCFAGVFMGVFSFAAKGELEEQLPFFDLERIQLARMDQTRSASSGFALGDVSTPLGALTAIPRGLVFLLFAPFPWSPSGLRQMLVVPEMLVWYALMPSFIRGFRYAASQRLRATLPIIIFMIMLTLAYAVTQGNIGTAYRQRTQITMFFFIFIGAGMVLKRKPESLLKTSRA